MMSRRRMRGHGRHAFGEWGMGPWRTGWKGPGGGRARRGDVRTALLALLAERPMHGYEMIQELETRTAGTWRPSPGSVYPTLQLLEDEELVTGREVEGKRTFSLTDAGRAEAEKGPATPWEDIGAGVDPAAFDLHKVGLGVLAATRQVLHAGTDEQKAKAVELLTDTRRGLYRLLAEEEGA